MHETESGLFTIRQAARFCGVSRTTLQNLELSGYLKPCRVEARTGYRYYDCNDIEKIRQYYMLQELGLKKADIMAYTDGTLSDDTLLSRLKDRQQLLNRCIEELSMREGTGQSYSFSFLRLPALLAYTETGICEDLSDASRFLYNARHHAVERGLQLCYEEPAFMIMHEDPRHRTACVCLSGTIPESDPDIQYFPACDAFSLLYFGDLSDIAPATVAFRDEIIRRQIRPAGLVRIIGPVAPENSSSNTPVHRFAIPIE